MVFQPALPDLIRTSSGVLWGLLGLALVLRRRQAPEARAFGILLLATTPDFIGTNLA